VATPVTATLRALGVARAAVGGASLLALSRPEQVARSGLLPLAVVGARALAVRDVAQGALLVSRPDPAMARAGSAIDVLHASSMLPVVALARRYRRPATISTLAALTWVALSEAAVRRGAG
jgi:hypothetical protein